VLRPIVLRFCATLAVGLSLTGGARADVSIVKTDTWNLFTQGRVGAFFSYGWGDADPLERPGEFIPLGAGLNTGNDTIPKIGPNGAALLVQGTFRSLRVRSGLATNQLGIGLRRKMSEDTTIMAYVAIWATIDSESQRKVFPVFADAREGYLKIESGRWGSLLAGRALDLFSRGATENDALYGHGYSLGFPGNIDTFGPTNGMTGFGVLAAFHSPGIVYATPVRAGLQLSVGVYDPTTIPDYYDSTREARPEAELTYDVSGGPVTARVFANGAFQSFYNAGSNVSANAYGAGYGGRIEVGPVHVGVAGHWGKGLGLQWAFQPSHITSSRSLELRWFDGYSVLGQYAAGPFDLNAGWGISRTFPLDSDKTANVSLPRQQAVSTAIVYHATDYLHLDVDYFHAVANWTLGESQGMDFLSCGVTATW
jgi:hypothetical protein